MSCTVAMWHRFLNTVMLCGTQISLWNNPETLNPSKEEHVTLFLRIQMCYNVDALASCQFDSLFERRKNHSMCRRFAVGLLNSVAAYVTLPIFRKYLLGRSDLKIVKFLILSKFYCSLPLIQLVQYLQYVMCNLMGLLKPYMCLIICILISICVWCGLKL